MSDDVSAWSRFRAWLSREGSPVRVTVVILVWVIALILGAADTGPSMDHNKKLLEKQQAPVKSMLEGDSARR